jgi:hypothetical protein
MQQPKKIPTAKVEALADRLQTSLKRRRPRTWLVVVTAAVAALVLLVLLAWLLHNPTESPRLEVVALDAVVAQDDTPRLTAQLAFPDAGDYSPSLLRGRSCVFLDARAALIPGQQVAQRTATSDASGRAVAEWSRPAPDGPETITVRYVDARYKQGSDDQASLFLWPRDSKILLVDLETMAQIEPDQWETAPPADIPLAPRAGEALQDAERKQYRVGYLALAPYRALTYRKVRGWVHAPREKERLPRGPVLGRTEYPGTLGTDEVRREQLKDLQTRFGGSITVIAKSPAAAQSGRTLGLRAIVLGPNPGAAGTLSAPGWAEVIPLLNP